MTWDVAGDFLANVEETTASVQSCDKNHIPEAIC